MATLSGALGLRRARSLEIQTLFFTIIAVVMIFSIVYPLTLLFINSFDVSQPGFASAWGLGNWREAIDDTTIWESLWNTFTTTAARGLIGWPIGIVIAWILARTNTPWANGLEFLFWISFSKYLKCSFSCSFISSIVFWSFFFGFPFFCLAWLLFRHGSCFFIPRRGL